MAELPDHSRLELLRAKAGGCAERLLQDARTALRGLRRNPGYASAVVLTLALGIGLNAAMYGLLSRLFLQAPPHVEDADGIHRVWVRGRGDMLVPPLAAVPRDRVRWADFAALAAGPARLSAVAGYTAPRRFHDGRGQTAEVVRVSSVTGGFFALLGAGPALGRPIARDDDDLAAPPVAVVGHGYSERRFGGAREALGATVTIGDVAYAIVGVMPPGFSGPDLDATDVWLPLQIAAPNDYESWRESNLWSLGTLVRLAPGVTAGAAASAATGRLRAARAGSPRRDPEAVVVLGPLLRTRGPAALAGDVRLPLVVGGVALAVLLIAVANVSNLLMLRVAARRRELAVRHALGAGRWGVARLLVTESVVLAMVSGVAALGVAAAAGRVLRVTLLPRHEWDPGPLDLTAIGFTGAAVLAVGFAAALLPGVYAARSRGLTRLDGLRGARAQGGPVRTGLIAAQAALTLVLLDGTVTFYRSFEAARRVDVGYARENLLTVELGGWNEPPIAEGGVDALEARVRSLPGVLDVAQATSAPLTTAWALGELRAQGLDRLPRMNGPYVNYVTPNFFRVAGLDIRAGRGFTAWDRAGTQKVAVVDTALARLVWPGQSAVGRCLFVGREAADCTTVVGVTESPLEFGLRDGDRLPHYYLPLDQAAADPETAWNLARLRNLIVRTRGDPGRATAPVLTALAELFPDLPADRVQSLPAVFAPRIRPWQLGTGLFGAAALLAVLLAAFGLYAVIAFGVRQRELEFGIRRALGARAGDLLRTVLLRALSLVVAGIAAGALGVLWVGRWVAPLLFDGRGPRDPLAFAVAAAVLVTAALAASFLPAVRAAQADPRQALQAE